jgi:hypothetical protein
VQGIEVIQSGAADEGAVVRQEDAEFVAAAAVAGRVADGEPGQRLVLGVSGMGPAHPLADSRCRFPHRLGKGGGVRGGEGTKHEAAGVQLGHVQAR